MTERAKQISAFVCPLGHFQWIRMPFGLKNAPLIYQKMIDNALWGYVRLPPHLEAEVEPEVMEALGLEVVSEPAAAQSELENASKTVFELNIPAPRCMSPVLQRSSYIDDIAYGASTLDELLDVLDKLLYRLRYWRISVSLPKSAFGKKSFQYLSHEVNQAGIIATPKIAKALRDMPFPTSSRGVQSFLGSLNYYNKFIEDYSVIASSLYELTDERIRASDSLDQAKRAFELLKSKILAPPLLKHPDRTKPYVIIPHANQEHDGVIVPVRFTGRTLHDAELSYHPAEKEILALLRVLNVYYTLLAGQDLVVYTRFSSLKWILTLKSVQGRLLQWSALLSPWTMEVRRVDRDEDGLSAILAASITPREKLDEVAAGLVPMKAMRVKPNLVSLEMLDAEYVGYVLSFDGTAKLKTSASSASFVLCELPGWHPVFAKSLYIEGITVNEAEHSGLLQGLAFAKVWRPEDPIRKLVIVGDSRIVVQQCQGLIRCNQPHLALLLARFHELQTGFESIDLVHVKREFNGAADYLAGLALRSGQTQSIEDPVVFDQLRLLNQLPDRLSRRADIPTAQDSTQTAQDPTQTAQDPPQTAQDPSPSQRSSEDASTPSASHGPAEMHVQSTSSDAVTMAVQTRSARRQSDVEVAVSSETPTSAREISGSRTQRRSRQRVNSSSRDQDSSTSHSPVQANLPSAETRAGAPVFTPNQISDPEPSRLCQ